MSKKDYRYIGKNTQRFDAVDVVTGKAEFLNDHKMDGLLYGKALRSPYAHARIKRIDISEAEALPGVAAVLYYGNLPEACAGWGKNMPPICPILRREASFVGDAVALVSAETEQIAEEALSLIKIEYEELPAVFKTREAILPDAPLVHEEFPTNIVPNEPFIMENMMDHLVRGDVDKAFEECDAVVEDENEYSSLGCPMAMEPPGVIMRYDGTRLKAWPTSQVAMLYSLAISNRVGMLPVDVEVFNIGGGFGNKAELPCISVDCAALAAATPGRPVKMNMSKTEQLMTHDQRIGMYMKCKIGLKDGVVHAVKGICYMDCGAYNCCGQWQMGVGLGECQVAFGKCQNWDIQGKMVMTNHVQTGAVRGFGGQEIKSVMMPIAMKAAAEAGVDPVEFCQKNFAQTGDGWYWREQNWYDCREQDYVPVMQHTAEKFGWKEKWKGWNVPTWTDGHKARGVGVSIHGNADIGEDNSEAYVRINFNGTVTLHAGIAETGAGQRSNIRKYVAEVLDLPIEQIIVAPCTTEANPFDSGPIGSRCTLTLGTAVTRAAEDALAKLLDTAAHAMHCSPEDIFYKDGFIAYKSRPEQILPPAAFLPFGTSITGYGQYIANYDKANFNIYFSEVEVDLDTGATKLLDVMVGTDVGQIIDPLTLEMQVHGGFGAAAADTGLMDENVFDRTTGRLLTSNMVDYKWRAFNDFPPIGMVIEESQPEISRFKATGFGEISGAPGPASMMMAISNAIGVDYCEYPASREGILKALGKL